MGFYQRTQVVEGVFTCDKRSCAAVLSVAAVNPNQHWKERNIAEAHAREAGWSRWHGRSVFYYCPDHGPAKPNPYRVRRPLERSW